MWQLDQYLILYHRGLWSCTNSASQQIYTAWIYFLVHRWCCWKFGSYKDITEIGILAHTSLAWWEEPFFREHKDSKEKANGGGAVPRRRACRKRFPQPALSAPGEPEELQAWDMLRSAAQPGTQLQCRRCTAYPHLLPPSRSLSSSMLLCPCTDWLWHIYIQQRSSTAGDSLLWIYGWIISLFKLSRRTKQL